MSIFGFIVILVRYTFDIYKTNKKHLSSYYTTYERVCFIILYDIGVQLETYDIILDSQVLEPYLTIGGC